MVTVRKLEDLKREIKKVKANNLSIGFVPTMGYLHDGHKSLMERARKENDVVVASIFVNPIQFGPNEDYEEYPRDEEHDAKVCMEAGCDIVFMPQASEMYPDGFCTYVEVSGLTEVLCGAARPGHFKGVCTVVTKLFNLVRPDKAYFGQKDAQQLAVIRKMVSDLALGIEIVGCPIVREADGLAMSSRNSYLSADERQQALVLSQSLNIAEKLVRHGVRDVTYIRNEMVNHIGTAKSASLEYVDFVDPNSLMPVEKIEGEVLVAVAVKIGKTRLIDNKVVTG
ncbi:MAG: pantoate--beta-alanine ligase [Clostridiales bacterium]|jgi:pantoate--beta-alanine ligase|nr:pantoate--beta-alanine ligase [Eubacteriales bacterium]MDH7565400.1 pantoate--beta-alanine ligase [Clostridiales bacterium]